MSKTVVTKVFKKNSNGQFSSAVPIGTSSEYVSVSKNGNQVMSLNTLIGDPSVFTETSLSDKVIEIEEKTGIADASATQKGLMSSADFKKINPQIIQNDGDLNNITNIGWYKIVYNPSADKKIASNVPEGILASCWMQVQQLSNSSFFQKIRTPSGIYFERQFTNNLWSDWSRLDKTMTAATDSTDGTLGTVPAPGRGQQNNFLRGDGTWAPVENTWVENTVNTNGYVLAPSSSNSNKVWKTDVNGNPGWRDEEKTSYNVLGASGDSTTNGVLVPLPASSQQNNNSFLRGNGTWSGLNGRLLTETEYNRLNAQGLFFGAKIEFNPPSEATYGGFIDFHHKNGTNPDYSARIIEWTPGTLTLYHNIDVLNKTTTKTLQVANTVNVGGDSNIEGNLTVRSDFGVTGGAIVRETFRVDNGLYASGGATISGKTEIKGILKTQRADNGENGHTIVVSSLAETGGVFMLNSYTGKSLQVFGNWGVKGKSSTQYISTNSSDIRLKENIKESHISGLQLINKIPLYEFDWKRDKQHQKIGFIADQLEKIDSNLSLGSQKPYDENGNPIYKSVNTFYLQGFEIKAIQELSQQNQELKKEIDSLKKEIKELKKKV